MKRVWLLLAAPEEPATGPAVDDPAAAPEGPATGPAVDDPAVTAPEAPAEQPEEDGGPIAWVGEHWDILLGVFVVVGLACLGKYGSSKKSASGSRHYTYYSSGCGGGSYDSDSSSTDIDWELHDELDAVQHAMRITEKYGEDWGGYDPEAPTDSSEIW